MPSMMLQSSETLFTALLNAAKVSRWVGGNGVAGKSAALLQLVGVWKRGYIESLRKRKLSIGGYTTSNFENQRFP